MAKVLLGIGYKAKHGKSVVRDVFIDRCSRSGLTCENFSFSEYVLTFCKTNGRIAEHRTRATLTVNDIRTLQDAGLEQRVKDPFFWVKKMFRDIHLRKELDVAIIDNLRYINECRQVLLTPPSFLARVDRYDSQGKLFVSPDRDCMHRSEVELDGWGLWDFRLANTMDVWWLRAQAATMFDYIADEVGLLTRGRRR